ncbi:MAG: bifunctional adenosylcobinamide kinase/adenosylcobinamide-phosphate guanylyltransferase [Candidatus Rokubacteria bacterium]|nr:bifunctional adenosylcobinamide kinase/adenosylcobinamide-phosphate guanylyltransferase [Candidatus Rokubacteria bacterium]
MASSLFVLGGARSGKSRFAVSSQPPHARVAFVATAEAGDADMAARIARHRAERPRHWITVEEPVDLVRRLEKLVGTVDAVLVDCLTLWVSNRLLRGDADGAILDECEGLAALVRRRLYGVTLVSNEVGEGVHPETAAGLRFRDLLGLVNQTVAAVSDRVVLMVAGHPLTVKEALPSDDVPPEAP